VIASPVRPFVSAQLARLNVAAALAASVAFKSPSALHKLDRWFVVALTRAAVDEFVFGAFFVAG
jgi:hypothetical protein